MNSTIPEDASPEWVAAMARQHYVSQQRQNQTNRPPHNQAHHSDEGRRNSQGHSMWNRGRSERRSSSTPPGRVSSSSPDVDTTLNQMHEMPFTPPSSGPVNSFMSPHYAMPAPGHSGTSAQPAERITSPVGSTAVVSPGMRRRTYGVQGNYGVQGISQSGVQGISQSGFGGSSASRPGPIHKGNRGNPAMPRGSFSNPTVMGSPYGSGRQAIPSMQSAVAQIDASKGSPALRRGLTWQFSEDGKMDAFSPHRTAEAAGSVWTLEATKLEATEAPRKSVRGLDVAEASKMAARRPSVLGDLGGPRTSEEMLLQATPPSNVPVSPAPPGFSTRLGNESGRSVRGALVPLSQSRLLSPGPVGRYDEDPFKEMLVGQKLSSNSWGGRFVRSTPDLTVTAHSYHQDELKSLPQSLVPSKPKKGNIAMYGTSVLGQSL